MALQPPTVWITRAEPGATATAERVKALGGRPLVAPLLSIEPLPAEIDLAGVGALAFTSANGVRAFAALCPARDRPVFAVGAGTAAAARTAGFRPVLSADGDVAALARGIIARKRELTGAVLHAAAAEPAGDLVGALTEAGVEARAVSVYDTVTRQPPKEVLDALGDIRIVLLHSPKAARALAGLLAGHDASHLRLLCLSPAVARPLEGLKVKEVAIAPFPIEAALLNLMARGDHTGIAPASGKRH